MAKPAARVRKLLRDLVARAQLLSQRWLLPQRLRSHGVYALFTLWTLTLCLLRGSGVGTYAEVNITQPFLFKARERLRQDPPLHPRLKIYSYDDGSVDMLQRADLTLDDWADVLSAIAAAKPAAIFIDKVFSIVFDPLGHREQSFARLNALNVPVYVGAFAHERVMKTRAALDTSGAPYRLADLLPRPDAARPGFDLYRGWFVYGPHPDFKQAFRAAGHILYEGTGRASAFLAPGPETIVPHLGLLAAGTREWKDGALLVDGVRVPLDGDGQILVNFSREDAYYERHKRLGSAVLAARQGKPVKGVEEGDTVLILPEMYTGSTDFKMTPLGVVPAGFVPASMLNAVLSRAWLAPAPLPELQLALFCVLGLFWGRYRKPLRYWLGQIGLTAAIVAGGVWLFSYRHVATPTLDHLVAFWGASLLAFADANLKREREAKRIAEELNDAAEMAKAFRPDELPTDWGFCEVAQYHRPFSEASGDWFAFRRGPGGRFHHFVMCDVTGHGVQAALMVAICKTVLALIVKEKPETLDTAAFLEVYARDVNAMLCQNGKGRYLSTMFGVTFDAETGEARHLSAGHPPPLLHKDNGRGGRAVRQLVSRTSPLGLKEDLKLNLATQKLAPGDELIVYTDGLPVGHQVRALNAFVAQPQAAFASAPEELLRAIWAAETKKTGRRLDDDVSIVWFKVAA